MIKQNWIVTEEERKRILHLHESATKKQYIFSEQTDLTTDQLKSMGTQLDDKGRVIEKIENKEIQFYFKTGYWSERATDDNGKTIVDQVDTSLKSIKTFLSQLNFGKILDVKIEASESAVRNRNNEDPKKPYLDPGVLSRMRSETIRNLLTQGFQGLVDSGLIKSIPNIVEDIKVGTAALKDSPEALKEQFVKVTFTIKGVQKTPPTTQVPPTLRCDFVLDIKVEYVPVPITDPKWHNCDDAEFTLLIADIPIKVKDTGSEIFSLNNYDDARAVQQYLSVDPDTAAQILAKGDIAKMEFKCMSAKGCHEAPLQMTISSDGKVVSGPRYMGRVGNRKDRMPTETIRKVAEIDKCGKLISVEDIGDEVIDNKIKQGS